MFQGAVTKETVFDTTTQSQIIRVSLTALFLFRITPQRCQVSEVNIKIVECILNTDLLMFFCYQVNGKLFNKIFGFSVSLHFNIRFTGIIICK